MAEASFQEELLHRTSQIKDLRAELWEGKDRVSDAEDRTQVLVQGIERLKAEVKTRTTKTKELEDKVASMERAGEEAARELANDAAASAAEALRSREIVTSLGQSRNREVAVVEEERRRAERLSRDLAAMRGQIELAEQELERARLELEREEAAAAARRERLAEVERRGARGRVEVAEGVLAEASRDVMAANLQVKRLEAALGVERESSAGLNEALSHTTKRRGAAAEEQRELELELAALEAHVEKSELTEAYAEAKSRCQNLAREVAKAQHDTAFQNQSLQGALDETRRMMNDHLDQTQSGVQDASFTYLVTALAEAKNQADDKTKAARAAQQQCDAAKAELQQEESMSATMLEDTTVTEDRRRAAGLAQELEAARHAHDTGRLRADEEVARAVRAEAQVLEVERAAKEKEAVLRKRLSELWDNVRLAGEAAIASSTRPVVTGSHGYPMR